MSRNNELSNEELGAELEPALNRARNFLRLLDDRDGVEFEFRAIHPRWDGAAKIRKLRGTLDECAADLTSLNRQGYGIFVTVNETDGKGVKLENIVRIRAVWCDLDRPKPSDKRNPEQLSRVEEVIASVEAKSPLFPLAPSAIYRTSCGNYQAYWLSDGGMTEDEFTRVMAGIVEQYGGDNGAKDLARVLRVSGFYHTKAEPILVQRFWKPKGDAVSMYSADELVQAFALKEEPKIAKSKSVRNVELSVAGRRFATWAEERRNQHEPEPIEVVLKKAAELLPAIPVGGLEYNDWLIVGQALFHETNGSEEGRDLWDGWSQGDDRYHEWDCESRWDGFKRQVGPKVGLGSVIQLARRLNPGLRLSWEKVRDEVEVPADGLAARDWGLQQQQQQEAWNEAKIGELMSRMNREHALVVTGSKTRYLRVTRDAEGRDQHEFMLGEDLDRIYSNVRLPIPDPNPSAKPRYESAFKRWDRWPGRKFYSGIGFFPGSPVKPAKVPEGFLNKWRGFAIEPKKSDWGLFREHLRKVVCARNETWSNWLMDWLAQLVQEPQRKFGASVVLLSKEKGTGKSMLNDFLRAIFGQASALVDRSAALTSQFNSRFETAVHVAVEEATFGGSHDTASIIKNLITSKSIRVEPKGLEAYDAPNYSRLVITSNEDWAVPVGIDERRFFVLEARNKRAKDSAYFDPIFRQMREEGGLEAMLHELLHREITADLWNPPETPALIAQRVEGMAGLERWLWTVARDGCISSLGGLQHELEDGRPTRIDRRHVRASALEIVKGHEVKSIEIRLGKLLSKCGVRSVEEGRGSLKVRLYVFPPLDEFREAVAQALKVPAGVA